MMMKFLCVSLLVVLGGATLDSDSFEAELLSVQFDVWAEEHGKEYHCEHEKTTRRDIWIQNHEFIEKHNNQEPAPKFRLGHNEYSDMTNDEFQKHFGLGQPMDFIPNQEPHDDALAQEVRRSLKDLELPDYVNWIAAGAVTPVKNQGACGSCWAFSTTGALEGAKFIHTGELVTLSEQNLLDCDHLDMGCSGGLMDNAFKFDEKSGGLCSEADYPYKARVGPACLTNCTDVPGSIVKTFVDVPPGDLRSLLSAVAMQPISVAIQAGNFAFQFYKSGVIDDDTCGTNGAVDHGVLAVGYGSDLETQTPYFLVKNSWGETWGEGGYVRLARNSTNEWGMCAILKMASFPVVE